MDRVAILMYHKVGAPVVTKRDRFLNVTPVAFERQVRVLGRLGYRVLPLAEAMKALTRGASLPARNACITFDDAYTCVRDHAVPILARIGHAATVYVPTGWVGDANGWEQPDGTPALPIMGWDDLRALRESGWEIGGHTRSHPRLGALGDAEARAEIMAGLADAAAELGLMASTFCYPFGDLNDRTSAMVREAGFLGACTTLSGVASSTSDPFLLPRVKVAFRDGVIGLLYRLLLRPHLNTRRGK